MLDQVARFSNESDVYFFLTLDVECVPRDEA